ncbi:PEP-CTERM sorting domain-containing protein [Roseateles sp. P5_E7]
MDSGAVLVSSPVPEPGAWALMLAGLASLMGLGRGPTPRCRRAW